MAYIENTWKYLEQTFEEIAYGYLGFKIVKRYTADVDEAPSGEVSNE